MYSFSQWGHKTLACLTLSDPGFRILLITLVPGFKLRALDCCLTLKLCVCFQRYKLNSYEKKISLNLKKSGIFHVFKKSYLAT